MPTAKTAARAAIGKLGISSLREALPKLAAMAAVAPPDPVEAAFGCQPGAGGRRRP